MLELETFRVFVVDLAVLAQFHETYRLRLPDHLLADFVFVYVGRSEHRLVVLIQQAQAQAKIAGIGRRPGRGAVQGRWRARRDVPLFGDLLADREWDRRCAGWSTLINAIWKRGDSRLGRWGS